MGANEESNDFYEFASAFENPVVRRHAAILRDSCVSVKSFDRPTIVEELVQCGIARIPAGDIVQAVREYHKKGRVGVFWDLENIGLPPNIPPLEALKALRDKIVDIFGDIVEFKAYVDLGVYTSQFTPDTRVMFRDCGVEMVDAPHNGRKEVADKHIIVDAMWFATHTENPITCIISGDNDFSPLLAKLKMSGMRTLLISTSRRLRSLREQATWALSWPEGFIRGAVQPADVPQRNRPTSPSSRSPTRRSPVTTSPSQYNYHPVPQQQQQQQPQQHQQQAPPPPPIRYESVDSILEEGPTKIPSTPAPAKEPLFAAAAQAQSTSATFPSQPLLDDPAILSVSQGQVSVVEGGVQKSPSSKVIAPKKTVSPRSIPDPSAIQSKSDEEEYEAIAFADLEDCIRAVQREVGMEKVKRSAVGVKYRRINPLNPFKQVVAEAAALGKIHIGGEMGHAWISLASNDDSANTPRQNNSDDVASVPSGADWYICLRYSRTFPSFGQLSSFSAQDPLIKVNFVSEPNGPWYRMSVGPFASLVEADNYCQLHFGEMNLLPKITTDVKKYVDPAATERKKKDVAPPPYAATR